MLQYEFMQNAIIVSILIAIMSPTIGIFLIQRRQSMIGDTLAHSALAGISIGLLINKNPIVSAFIFSSLIVGVIEILRFYFKKYSEISLSVIMSLSVGVAITLISSGRINANVNSYLFGSILTVSKSEVYVVLFLSIISLLTIVLIYDKLLCWVFDEYNSKVNGINVNVIRVIFSILTSSAIAISIKIVGTLVISSILILPVATAMQFSFGFKKTLVASILISLIDILISLYLSFILNLAPGGVIALNSVFTLLFVILIKFILSSKK